jgi:hypothetical protein
MWRSFHKRLQELGYAEGQNLAVEFIDLTGTSDQVEAMKELVRRGVNVIIASGTENALRRFYDGTDEKNAQRPTRTRWL